MNFKPFVLATLVAYGCATKWPAEVEGTTYIFSGKIQQYEVTIIKRPREAYSFMQCESPKENIYIERNFDATYAWALKIEWPEAVCTAGTYTHKVSKKFQCNKKNLTRALDLERQVLRHIPNNYK